MHFIDVQKPYTPSHIRQMLLNLAMDLEARRDLWKYPTAKQIEAEEADPNLMDERWFLVFGRSLEENFVRNGLEDILKWLDFRHPSVAFEIHSLTDQLTKLIPAKPNIGLDDQDHIIVQLAQAAFHLRQYADSIPVEESSKGNNTLEQQESEVPIEQGLQLPKSAQRAWAGFKHVEKDLPDNATDDDAYEALCELKGEHVVADKLPKRESWKRYLRSARNYYDENKNTPRVGRDVESGSIVRQSDC